MSCSNNPYYLCTFPSRSFSTLSSRLVCLPTLKLSSSFFRCRKISNLPYPIGFLQLVWQCCVQLNSTIYCVMYETTTSWERSRNQFMSHKIVAYKHCYQHVKLFICFKNSGTGLGDLLYSRYWNLYLLFIMPVLKERNCCFYITSTKHLKI